MYVVILLYSSSLEVTWFCRARSNACLCFISLINFRVTQSFSRRESSGGSSLFRCHLAK